MCFRPGSVNITKKCPECGAEAGVADAVCPECGASLKGAKAGGSPAPSAPAAPAAPATPGAPKPPLG